MNQLHPSKKPKPPLNNYVRYSSLAIQMILIITIFTWGGRKLDTFFKFHFPVLTLILSLTGVFLAIYFSIKDFIKK